MDEQEKPFDIVSIVILILIGLANDAAEIVFDLLAATVVGLPGEAIMEPVNFLVDGAVTAWFVYKVGFGWPTILQLIDDALEFFGIPGRTASIAIGIWIANHPSSKVAKLAKVVGTVESLGESEVGELAEGAEAAGRAGAAAEETTVAAGVKEIGTAIEGAATDDTGKENSQSENPETSAREKEIEEQLEPEAEKNPMEVEATKLNEGPTLVQDIRNRDDDERRKAA